MTQQKRAFTLIELLVVIGIIGVLASFILGAMSGASHSGRQQATRALLLTLQQKIEAYANDFHDFPPSQLARIGVTSQTNGQNEGIECLLICLTTKAKNGPYFEPRDNATENTDNDSVPETFQSLFAGPELFEIVDAWGQPIVYLHNRDYQKSLTVLGMNKNGLLEATLATGQKTEKTGQFQGLTSFQLMSVGADGQFGTDDDISIYD